MRKILRIPVVIPGGTRLLIRGVVMFASDDIQVWLELREKIGLEAPTAKIREVKGRDRREKPAIHKEF